MDKIEKLEEIHFEGYDALKGENRDRREVAIVIEKVNEIIDYLNSQSQPEKGTQSTPMPDISSLPRRNGEYRYPEDYTGDSIGETTTTSSQDTPEEWSWKFLKGGCEPTDYSKQPKMEEELHDKLLEIWCGLLPTPSKASFDPEPIRIRIEGTEKYVKQLLEDKDEKIQELEDKIYDMRCERDEED